MRTFLVVAGTALLAGALLYLITTTPLSAEVSPSLAARVAPNSAIQSSAWDGSVPQVKDWLKNNMSDPDSLQYISWTKIGADGDHLVVGVKFRSKTGFGNDDVRSVLFHLDPDGKIIGQEDSASLQ